MAFDKKQLAEMVGGIQEVSREAGRMLLDGLDGAKGITHKGAVDLVTEFDLRSEEMIKKRLEKLTPGVAILAEESGGAERLAARWIVDPLDGTTNFAHGHPIFAVSIGLEDHGQLVLGVIDIPGLGLQLWATQGGGAFCNGDPIRVSSQTQLGKSLVASGFPYDRWTAADNNSREFAAFIRRAQGVRRMGAAVVDLAMVARGVYDGFWEPKLKAWDLAAGVVIVREAGGQVSDYSGSSLDIDRGWVVATNGQIHSQLLKVIEGVRAPAPAG